MGSLVSCILASTGFSSRYAPVKTAQDSENGIVTINYFFIYLFFDHNYYPHTYLD